MALALSTGPRSNRRLNGMGGKVGGSAATAVQKECSAACMLSTSCASSCTWAWASVQDDDRDGGKCVRRDGARDRGWRAREGEEGVGEADVNVDPVAKEDIQPRGHAPA
ncbi:hypothetical protein B0H14DRAFT_3904615 [Mycena olivaceomarginata]|nr:hypothetical protein B0H14DRAFT_3904615 [Mycena olivaceomarginata]